MSFTHHSYNVPLLHLLQQNQWNVKLPTSTNSSLMNDGKQAAGLEEGDIGVHDVGEVFNGQKRKKKPKQYPVYFPSNLEHREKLATKKKCKRTDQEWWMGDLIKLEGQTRWRGWTHWKTITNQTLASGTPGKREEEQRRRENKHVER